MSFPLSTADVSTEERVDWFADVVGRGLAPTEINYSRSEDFEADVSFLAFGSVQLSKFSYVPLRSRRTPGLIRRGDPEQYHVALVKGGPMWISQQRSDSGPVVDSMVIWDTSRPFEAGAPNDGGLVRSVILQIPKPAVGAALSNRIDRILARPIPTDTSIGAVLAHYMSTLATHGESCSADERGRLGRISTELFTSLLAQHLDTTVEISPESWTVVLREEINRFINQHLAAPDLTPQVIASRHNISLRRLHQLFEEESETVAATIRSRRLAHCRADLENPQLRHLSVQAIALRWGFASAAAFNRTFRQAFGTTPTQIRRLPGVVELHGR